MTNNASAGDGSKGTDIAALFFNNPKCMAARVCQRIACMCAHEKLAAALEREQKRADEWKAKAECEAHRANELGKVNNKLVEEAEQLRVQLAGCGVAALGHADGLKCGDYGWSASFHDVLTLRARADRLQAEINEQRDRCKLENFAALGERLTAVTAERDEARSALSFIAYPTFDEPEEQAVEWDTWQSKAARAALEKSDSGEGGT